MLISSLHCLPLVVTLWIVVLLGFRYFGSENNWHSFQICPQLKWTVSFCRSWQSYLSQQNTGVCGPSYDYTVGKVTNFVKGEIGGSQRVQNDINTFLFFVYLLCVSSSGLLFVEYSQGRRGFASVSFHFHCCFFSPSVSWLWPFKVTALYHLHLLIFLSLWAWDWIRASMLSYTPPMLFFF